MTATPASDSVRARWDGLGPWHQEAATPWGTKVVHADYGEAYLGTSLRVSPPTEDWAEHARAAAHERRNLMCRVARAIAAAPDDIALLLEENTQLRAACAGPGEPEWLAMRVRLRDRFQMAREVLDAHGHDASPVLVPIEEVLSWMGEIEAAQIDGSADGAR